MAAPVLPYVISGTVRIGPAYRTGYGEATHTVDTTLPGATVDVYVDSGTGPADTVTINILNVTTGESATTSTDSNGEYIYDLANLTNSYSNSDSIRVYYNNADATRDVPHTTADSTAKNLPEADGRFTRVIEPGRQGREHTEAYPLPVLNTDREISFENPSSDLTYSSGLIATETKNIKGTSYRKSYTWASGNLTGESRWVRI